MSKTEKKNRGYLTGREIKAIAKANAKEIKRLEAYKNRKAEESEFLTEMKDPKALKLWYTMFTNEAPGE